MKIDQLKEWISLYIDGQATPEQEDAVLNALKDSEELRAYYQDLLSLSASLHEWGQETLSPDLERTIAKNVFKQEDNQMKLPRWIPIGATLAVAVLIFVISRQSLSFFRQTPPDRSSVTRTASLTDKSSPSTQYEPYYLDIGQVTASAPMLAKEMSPEMVSHGGGFKSASFGSAGFYHLDTDVDVPASQDYWLPASQDDWPSGEFNTEQYNYIAENEFLNVTDHPLSTFSIDVDTASYANVRRFLTNGQRPPVDAVRIEELINYFVYDYPQPDGADPFSVTVEVAPCPWDTGHQLAMIGLQGKILAEETIPDSNLVFLIDVSGSMNTSQKLPLLKHGFKMMVNELSPNEKVSIVTYAGRAAVLLDSVPGAEKQRILSAIDELQAGGSTAGAQGILTAYELARKNFITGGNNRVILATDGDFNIGVSSDSELIRLIEEKRQDGIFLTILGFGMGNYKDGRMEQLANKGNGNYYYIDTELEAVKVMARELGSLLFTIAKDVKLQIEFNPAHVKGYRLVGYENRRLNKEDFNDDTKDAGELGAGHTVTAFYEIIPADNGQTVGTPVDPLKYQQLQAVPSDVHSDEVMTVKLRYKDPDSDTSKLISRVVTAAQVAQTPSQNHQWASAVAEFGMLLRDSKFKGSSSFENVLTRARAAKGADSYGYRQEFLELVDKARRLIPRSGTGGYGFKGNE